MLASADGPAGAQRDERAFREKIDIIDYDEDPARFVANALSPAKVVSVTVIDQAARAAG
ncbi:nusA-like KH domain protein [Mycobacterium xenopi 4042]|uniref:NusA-like KH domain protein n=1 Tax=Mycobacterium xenopi 4042 TaxID=1299334 RepID=X8CEZ3_MYCXE|nr:nusA-like KH domain protein [Mycobacterium xenopi 4042]